MITISELKLSALHNEGHFQFNRDFKSLINRFTPAALDIEADYAPYLLSYDDEEKCLNVIRKSAFSDPIAQADQVRENTFRGMRDAVKSACRHYEPEVRQAATRLQVIFDQYGDITTKSRDDETAAINQLNTELNTSGSADIAVVGLSGWIAGLQANNEAFEALQQSRYSEDSEKPDLKMLLVRKQLDDAYHTLTRRIDALNLVNKDKNNDVFIRFINELNSRISSYSTTLAMRQGHQGNGEKPGTDAGKE